MLLIPLYAHPDLRGFSLAAYLISQQGELFTFYDYLSLLPANHQLVRQYFTDLFIYPPLAYLAPASFMTLLSPLYPWPLFSQYLFDSHQVLGQAQFPWVLYLIKLPYLIADLICLWLVFKLAPSRHRLLAALLWALNPVSLYVTFLIGQFDIYIVLFLLLSLMFTVSGKSLFSSISLGLGAGFKPFPLFLLPLTVRNSSWSSRLFAIGIGLLTYVLIIAPYLGSPGFKSYALLANHSHKVFYAQLPVSTTQSIFVFVVGLGLVFWWQLSRPQDLPIWGWYGAVTLIFFSVTHFHPQWFLWGTPFLLLSAATWPRTRLPVIALFLLYFALVLTFEPSLNFRILGSDFSLSEFLNKFQLADTFSSILRSLFAATSLWLLMSWRTASHAD